MANNSSSSASLNRRQVAQALNIPPEMAVRNGIPSRMKASEVAALDANPPARRCDVCERDREDIRMYGFDVAEGLEPNAGYNVYQGDI